MNFVLVGSDKFGQNRSRWSWVGHDRMNARISQCKNAVPQWVLNMAVCALKTRYPNVPHPNVKSTADEHEFR